MVSQWSLLDYFYEAGTIKENPVSPQGLLTTRKFHTTKEEAKGRRKDIMGREDVFLA